MLLSVRESDGNCSSLSKVRFIAQKCRDVLRDSVHTSPEAQNKYTTIAWRIWDSRTMGSPIVQESKTAIVSVIIILQCVLAREVERLSSTRLRDCVDNLSV